MKVDLTENEIESILNWFEMMMEEMPCDTDNDFIREQERLKRKLEKLLEGRR